MGKQVIVAIAMLMLAGTCKKDGADCHHDVILKNASTDTVIFAFRATSDGECNLQGTALAPMTTLKDGGSTCWEDKLANGSKYEVFMISRTGYNDTSEYYHCDSVESRNVVLGKRELSIEALRAIDFVVTYP